MPAPDLSRVKEIFSQATTLQGEQRAAYLDQACSGDAALRAEVEAYLAVSENTDALLGATASPHSPLLERPGTIVGGRYKLLQQIGEGGFGVVFMAQQDEPVRRNVALKIIKLGMDTIQVVTRFEAERQALAIMDHPGIAKVFDGGSTETGRPFFVMELVKGVPITSYCDKNHLSIPERLDLFIQVCQAMQHAHQKGLIHRDVKPSNVLVSTQDDRPAAKIIDFGIA
ncbi:MAG TPA: serine/threonine-protein kinase, partial [Tepidisphaeraceae bacterium]